MAKKFDLEEDRREDELSFRMRLANWIIKDASFGLVQSIDDLMQLASKATPPKW